MVFTENHLIKLVRIRMNQGVPALKQHNDL